MGDGIVANPIESVASGAPDFAHVVAFHYGTGPMANPNDTDDEKAFSIAPLFRPFRPGEPREPGDGSDTIQVTPLKKRLTVKKPTTQLGTMR